MSGQIIVDAESARMARIILADTVELVELGDLKAAAAGLRSLSPAEEGDSADRYIRDAVFVVRAAWAIAAAAHLEEVLGDRETQAIQAVIVEQWRIVGNIYAAEAASTEWRN